MNDRSLLAHWPLRGDARDRLGRHHGTAHQVTFGKGPTGSANSAAVFNGRDSSLEIPDASELRFSNRDFSIALWARCHTPMRGVFGDLLSKFDPAARCGVNLSVAGSSPAYSAMSDTRHAHFGIDDGYLGEWEDCGKPCPSSSLISNLVVFDGALYAGIADADNPQDAAHVFRWAGGAEWTDCGRLGNDPNHLAVMSLLVHGGKLYAGTGIWDWIRAQTGDAGQPRAAATRAFVYEGGVSWRDLGQVGDGSRMFTMASFQGELYVGLDRVGRGRCFKLAGSGWGDCGMPDNDNLECLQPMGGTLYAATHRKFFRYAGAQNWLPFAIQPHGITQIHCLQVFGGRLHAGTWPQGFVLRYEGGDHWVNTGRLGIPPGLGTSDDQGHITEINEVMDLVVHNGKLYAGVIPKAQVYRYEMDGHWTLLGSLASRPDYNQQITASWNRVTCFATHQGRLFAGTGSCRGRACDADPDGTLGRVCAAQAGLMVSHERDIGGDWTHLAAVRQGRQLRLYVNGRLSASSTAPAGNCFELSNTQPLRIGFGPQSSFDGTIADVRLYGEAITESELAQWRFGPARA
ncbi:MAG: LamG domain-containing protein [Verrucomicrobia bacterium]|nr:LamG domain-containing protein [Verrucomicrobiota bacterium]